MSGKLPGVSEIDVAGKSVIVRADLEWEGENCPRQVATERMVAWLKERGGARIKVIGHKGNWQTEAAEVVNDIRNDPREEADDESLARELATGFDVYVNEAFATSHRKHCSIDALPRWMKREGKQAAAGLRFGEEIAKLSQVFSRPGRKVLVIGGAKATDKEKYAELLKSKFDAVLKGGLLDNNTLRPDGMDINDESIERYKQEITRASEIVVAGPMGRFEDPTAGSGQADKGTREIFMAVVNCLAYKVAGGGSTEEAIAKYGIAEKFDWISVGGGAMLEFLQEGTLPGIEALIE